MDWITKLLSLPKYGAGIGLHRIDYLCKDLQQSSWWQDLHPINIVGTNGKGSTTAMVAAILHKCGVKNGQFTSPHLFDFSERIQFDCRLINAKALDLLVQGFFKQREGYQESFPEDHFGAFEAFTSLALHYFFEQKADTVVLEAGIGGRYDATRICGGDLVGLTSLDLEHTELLGNSLEQIAMDKIDIARTGATVVLGDVSSDLIRKLEVYARLKGIQLIAIREACQIRSVQFSLGKMVVSFTVEGVDMGGVRFNLLGPHQISNMLVAVLLVKRWLALHRPEVSVDEFVRAAQKALASIQWRGRFEKISDYPLVYIDIGHTPHAMTQLSRTVREVVSEPVLLVFGVSEGREVTPLFDELSGIAASCMLTASHHKGTEAAQLYRTLVQQRTSLPFIETEEVLEKALEKAVRKAKDQDMAVLITGSLFLAAEAYAYFKGSDPRRLKFF